MNVERIRERFRSAGFKPFSLRTSDGKEYDIPYPGTILVAPNTVVVLDADHETVSLDPINIVAIKDLPAKKNGGSRKVT